MDMIVGVISDTHGMLTTAAGNALKGVDRILHAGDIDGPEILQLLADIAPVTAVRGNMDHGRWADALHPTDMMSLSGILIYMLHNLERLDLDPAAAGVKIVICGHTHQAQIKTIDGVLYLNPGSASYGRYGSPGSVAILKLANGRIEPSIVALDG
jgi:putative phosphoesterase